MAGSNFFNFDAAMTTAKAAGQQGIDLLNNNRTRFESMAADEINGIFSLMAAGKAREAMAAFYAKADWSALEAAASKDVTDSAAFAQKAADAKEFFNQFGIFAAKALLTILVAGFCA
jgi:hypothetical protein